MVILGIILLALGGISRWAMDNRLDVGDQVWNMDTIGAVLLFAGALSIILGAMWMAMATNTSHREEHDVIVDKVPDEDPVVIKRRRPRR